MPPWDRKARCLALAATARHAIAAPQATMPELIIGHGVLGRLMARIAIAMGAHCANGVGNEPRARHRWRGLSGSGTPMPTRAAIIA